MTVISKNRLISWCSIVKLKPDLLTGIMRHNPWAGIICSLSPIKKKEKKLRCSRMVNTSLLYYVLSAATL